MLAPYYYENNLNSNIRVDHNLLTLRSEKKHTQEQNINFSNKSLDLEIITTSISSHFSPSSGDNLVRVLSTVKS